MRSVLVGTGVPAAEIANAHVLDDPEQTTASYLRLGRYHGLSISLSVTGAQVREPENVGIGF